MEKLERIPRHVAIGESGDVFEQYDLVDTQAGDAIIVNPDTDKVELTKIGEGTLEGWRLGDDLVTLALFREGFRTGSVVMRQGDTVRSAKAGDNTLSELCEVEEVAVMRAEEQNA